MGRLQRIRADNPAKLIWQHGQGKYLIGDQFPKAFCKAFGTPNLIHRTTTCEAARHVADDITWGYHGFLPDIAHTNLFLVFGSNHFGAEQYARRMDHAITDARERGMKVVVVEPRLSHAGAKADQWFPVRPGKDVALVMAVSRLLIETGQIDEAFLTTFTNAPQLVGAEGLILRDAGGAGLVWDLASGSLKPFVNGVQPLLAFPADGSIPRPELDGVPLRTAFEVYRDYSAREAVEILWLNATGGKPFETALRDGFKGSIVPATEIYPRGLEAKFKGPGAPKMQFYADSMLQTFANLRQVALESTIPNIDVEAYRIAYSPVPLRAHAFPTPHREAADYPLYLITFKRLYRNQMASSSLNPILNFALGADAQENALLINPITALALGVRDGAQVRIETRAGSATGKCRFTEGIRPDTVGVSHHYGHRIGAFPDYARRGIAINQALELHPDLVSGMNSFNDTKCRIRQIEV